MTPYWYQILKKHAAMVDPPPLLRVFHMAQVGDTSYYRYKRGGEMSFATARRIWDMLDTIEKNEARLERRNKKRRLSRDAKSSVPKTGSKTRAYSSRKTNKSGGFSF
jgi:hypothetical protein